MEAVGQNVLNRALPEWRLYWVDARALKQILRVSNPLAPLFTAGRKRSHSVATDDEEDEDLANEESDEHSSSSNEEGESREWLVDGYLSRLRREVDKVRNFYLHKQAWLQSHKSTLQRALARHTADVSKDGFAPDTAHATGAEAPSGAVPGHSRHHDASESASRREDGAVGPLAGRRRARPVELRRAGAGRSAGAGAGSRPILDMGCATPIGRAHHTDAEQEAFMSPSLSAACAHDRTADSSMNRHRFLVLKKALRDFKRELGYLKDYLRLNKAIVVKALRGLDKHTRGSRRESFLHDNREPLRFFDAEIVKATLRDVRKMIERLEAVAPSERPEAWYQTKVFTVGCFDLFHRGHENLFKALRDYGNFVVAGIHDDQSYLRLKGKLPVDNLETRMENVRPHVDMLFVIPSTDPTFFIRCMVSPQDIAARRACFIRGEDMESFPGRDWVETVMPVHFLPRSMGVSSTLVRSLCHGEEVEGLALDDPEVESMRPPRPPSASPPPPMPSAAPPARRPLVGGGMRRSVSTPHALSGLTRAPPAIPILATGLSHVSTATTGGVYSPVATGERRAAPLSEGSVKRLHGRFAAEARRERRHSHIAAAAAAAARRKYHAKLKLARARSLDGQAGAGQPAAQQGRARTSTRRVSLGAPALAPGVGEQRREAAVHPAKAGAGGRGRHGQGGGTGGARAAPARGPLASAVPSPATGTSVMHSSARRGRAARRTTAAAAASASARARRSSRSRSPWHPRTRT